MAESLKKEMGLTYRRESLIRFYLVEYSPFSEVPTPHWVATGGDPVIVIPPNNGDECNIWSVYAPLQVRVLHTCKGEDAEEQAFRLACGFTNFPYHRHQHGLRYVDEIRWSQEQAKQARI